MVGELTLNETRGMLLITQKLKTGVLQTNVHGDMATIEIREGTSKVTPVLYTDGSCEFKIKTKVMVGLGDQSGAFNLSDPDNVQEMLNAAQTDIRKEIQSSVDKAKELGADVFGFGEYIHRKYPDQWKKLKSKWNEEFKKIKIDISVDIKADGSGRTVKPLTPPED
jgi:hypothetical protein